MEIMEDIKMTVTDD